jgi:4-oxalmesaconate hydratase
MIIDCHGHYTTEPKDLHRFRKEQTEAANAKDKSKMPARSGLKMSDDEIRESIEQNQLKLQRERGTDLTIFSPRASGMGHHVGDESVSTEWSQICNDLIARVVSLYPKNFIGVCQLPQSPGVDPKNSAKELERWRLFQLAADDRQVLVPAVREDDRARLPVHDPRLGLL